MSIIRVEHLEKSYGQVTPIKDMSFEVNEGDVISIIGPSGCGKSTLIRCINMLEKPTAGKVFVRDECVNEKGYNLSRLRTKVGMVFQSFNLFSHRTILENVMMAPMDLLGLSREEAEKRAVELLDSVGLLIKRDSYPDELSGGQKQRAAIARALAMEPEVLLLDEPTSALDPRMVHEVEKIIEKLAHEGRTMMIVTHEMDFARAVSNRVFFLDQGTVYEEGRPEEIFDNPRGEKTRAFINSIEVFEWDSRDTDFCSMQEMLTLFVAENSISSWLFNALSLILEETIVGYVAISDNVYTCDYGSKSQLRMRIDYSRNTKSVRIHLYWNGPTVKHEALDSYSKIIIDGYGENLVIESAVEGYDNHLSVDIAGPSPKGHHEY